MTHRRIQHHRRNSKVVICLADGRRLSCPSVPAGAAPRDRQEVFSLVLRGDGLAAHELAEALWRAAEGRPAVGAIVSPEVLREWIGPEEEDEARPARQSRRSAA